MSSPFSDNPKKKRPEVLHGGYGPTQDSVRMFIVPGMGHCGGGSTQTPNSFDTLQALHNWVTKGVAPEGIVATATNGRTMPLCKWPEEASYLGATSTLPPAGPAIPMTRACFRSAPLVRPQARELQRRINT